MYLALYEKSLNANVVTCAFAKPRVHVTPKIVRLCFRIADEQIETMTLLNFLSAMRIAWSFYFNPLVGFHRAGPNAMPVDRVTRPNHELMNHRATMLKGPMGLPVFHLEDVSSAADILKKREKGLARYRELMVAAQARYINYPTDIVREDRGEFPGPHDRTRFVLEFELALFVYHCDTVVLNDEVTDDDIVNWRIRCNEWMFLKMMLLAHLIQARKLGEAMPTWEQLFERMSEPTPHYTVQHPVFTGYQNSLQKFNNPEKDRVLEKLKAQYSAAQLRLKMEEQRQGQPNRKRQNEHAV